MIKARGIDLAECAMLLGQLRLLLWARSKVGQFALPAGTNNGRPFWHEDDVYRWAASTHPELIRRIPIRCWPDAKDPAIYYGAREIEDATIQTWGTDPGIVCVVWSHPPLSELSLRDVSAQLPDADALIQVQSDFDIFGPRLSTARPDNLTEHNDFGMRWADLARALGQPVPYWPHMLRISSLIVDWKPGAPPVTYPTHPRGRHHSAIAAGCDSDRRQPRPRGPAASGQGRPISLYYRRVGRPTNPR